MEIISTAVVAIERGIGEMMKPITHTYTPIDLRPERDIADHLEGTSHVLVGEMMHGKERDSCPDL